MTRTPVSIVATIEKQLKEAQKQKNEVAVSTLRLLLAALKNYEIQQYREELTDEAVIKVLKTEVRKHEESIAAYKAGSRQELADREQQELDIIKSFLPPELTADEIRSVVKEVIEKSEGQLNFGRVMGETMKQIKEHASGNLVSQIVKEMLTRLDSTRFGNEASR